MKTVGIAARGSAIESWDPDSIGQGLPGSEEAVVYIAEQLARRGLRVLVFGAPPKDSRHSLPHANPRYLHQPIRQRLDVAICWRMPQLGVEMKQAADKVYLWPHDPCKIRMTQEECGSYDGVLWLSETQRRQWCSLNPELSRHTEIFGNGLDTALLNPLTERVNPYSCIYGSNYGAGLGLLLNIWPEIKQAFPRAELDIYYGWNHWGFLTEEQESALKRQLAELSTLDVREHGRVGHAALNAAYQRASFWTYPCTVAEMFCISALRAQLAGAVPVVTLLQGSALAETVRYGYACVHPQDYCNTLLRALADAERLDKESRANMGAFIRERYSWQRLADHWLSYMSPCL